MLTNLQKVVFKRGDKFIWIDELGDESCYYGSEEEAIAAVTQYCEYLNGNLGCPNEEITESLLATLHLARANDHVKMNQLYSHPIAKDFYDFSLFLESLPGSIEMTDLQNRFQELRRKTEMHLDFAIRLVG
jgi:hypothetical protein